MANLGNVIMAAELEVFCCGECGGQYALGKRYVEKKREQGGFWTCPYCACSWGYSKSGTENARLKRELEEQRRRTQYEENRAARANERAEKEARRSAAARGQVTKIKRRVAKGACPACQHTFPDLHAHMETEHPEWAGSKPEEEGDE